MEEVMEHITAVDVNNCWNILTALAASVGAFERRKQWDEG